MDVLHGSPDVPRAPVARVPQWVMTWQFALAALAVVTGIVLGILAATGAFSSGDGDSEGSSARPRARAYEPQTQTQTQTQQPQQQQQQQQQPQEQEQEQEQANAASGSRGCSVDAECEAGMVCSPSSAACVECRDDAQCPPGMACSSEECVPVAAALQNRAVRVYRLRKDGSGTCVSMSGMAFPSSGERVYPTGIAGGMSNSEMTGPLSARACMRGEAAAHVHLVQEGIGSPRFAMLLAPGSAMGGDMFLVGVKDGSAVLTNVGRDASGLSSLTPGDFCFRVYNSASLLLEWKRTRDGSTGRVLEGGHPTWLGAGIDESLSLRAFPRNRAPTLVASEGGSAVSLFSVIDTDIRLMGMTTLSKVPEAVLGSPAGVLFLDTQDHMA